MFFILIALVIYFVAGFTQVALKNNHKHIYLIPSNLIAMVLVLIPSIQVLLTNVPIEYSFNILGLIGTAKFKIDVLSAFFAIVISCISFICIIYSKGYLQPYIQKNKSISAHLFFFNLLILAMLLVILSQNAIFFLICWETMSISSLFLVNFENEKKEVLKASIKYLVYMHISVLFILLAFIFINIKAGTFNFDGFKTVLQNSSYTANIFFVLSFIGFSIKAGFIPFHNWLPDAHPAAPSHVSGLMSGVMIKTGIYGILRVITLIGVPSLTISYSVLLISLVTAIYGILYAVAQQDLKKLLAYSSIENIGIIGIGIGCGMLGLAYSLSVLTCAGFLGAMLHIFNHSIFKSLLFFGAGTIYNKTHTRNMEQLGGLLKKMPVTAICFLVGAISICGLPPFNGFVSEILIYFSMFKGMFVHDIYLFLALMFSFAGVAFVGVMAILCFTKAFSIVFLGQARNKEIINKVDSKGSSSMTNTMIFLSLVCLLAGCFPKKLISLVQNILPPFIWVNNLPVDFINKFSYISLSLFCVCVLAIIIRIYFCKKERSFEVWGCGYCKQSAKIQYTSSSFVSLFLEITRPLFVRRVDIKKSDEIFPKEAHYKSDTQDIEEELIVKPVIDFDERFLEQFHILQNGNLQRYILYGLIFLVVMIVTILVMEL